MVFDWVYLLDEQARGEDGVRSERAYRVIQRMRFDLPAQRAARFLWLSAMAFNGLWRVNSRGENNVGPDPARLAGKAPLPPMLVFERAAEAVREVEFWLDWGQALSRARAGDVVLADPPYGTFSGYTAGGFGEQDHHALSIALEVWMRRHGGEGGAVVAFNAPGARKLYSWARVEEMARSGRVNSKATARGRVAELLITAGLEEAEGPA
jgi:DNA adenine methylase